MATATGDVLAMLGAWVKVVRWREERAGGGGGGGGDRDVCSGLDFSKVRSKRLAYLRAL